MTDPDTTPQSPLPSGQISEGDWYTCTGGKQYGPYPVQLLIQGIQDGRATRDLLVWRRGLGEWMTIGQLPEFAMLFQPGVEQPQIVVEPSASPEVQQPFATPGAAPAGGPPPPNPGEVQRDLREITEVELQLLMTHFALSSEFQGIADGVLREEDFHPAKEMRWASLHKAMASVLKSGKPGPMSADTIRIEVLRQDDGLTLIEQQEAFLNGLDSYDQAKLNVPYAMDVLQRFVDSRQVWLPMSNLDLGSITVAEAGETFTNLVAKTRLGVNTKPESALLKAFGEDLIAQQQNPRKLLGYSTGFASLDEIINGLPPGTITILAGAPATGKTTLLKQIADTVAGQKVPVVFISFEQSTNELRLKSIGRITGCNTRDLVKGRDPQTQPGNDRTTSKIQAAILECSGFADHLLLVNGEATHTPGKIRSIVRAEQTRHGIEKGGLLVLDYLQLMPCVSPLTGRDFPSIREKLNHVLAEMRRLARDLEVAVLAVSSLNRTGYSMSAPKLEDFKETGNIEYSADVALVLKEPTDDVRESESDEPADSAGGQPGAPESPSDKPRDVVLHVLKNRAGDRGRVRMEFFSTVATFSEKPWRP